MTRAGVAVLFLALVGGCGPKDDTPPPAPPPLPVDAPLAQPSVTELPVFDPTAGHLDGLPEGKERETPSPPSKRNRNARMIGIMLRSTPSGAIAAVDGLPLGPTPAYWEGEFTGGEREFTFALANHAVARYRFIPTTNGVVHGRLEPIDNKPGAVVPAIPRPAQSTAPLRSTPGTTSPPSGIAPSAPVTTPEPGDAAVEPAPSAPVTAPGSTPTAPAGSGAPPTIAPTGAAAPSAPVAPSAAPPAPTPTTPPAQ